MEVEEPAALSSSKSTSRVTAGSPLPLAPPEDPINSGALFFVTLMEGFLESAGIVGLHHALRAAGKDDKSKCVSKNGYGSLNIGYGDVK